VVAENGMSMLLLAGVLQQLLQQKVRALGAFVLR
jgi:hypothetical protein